MPSQRLLNHLPEVLEHAWVNARAPGHPTDRTMGFTIAISRQAGIDSAAIAHEVGKRLDWPVYDQELLERIAEEMHLRPDLLERVDERPVRWVIERLETFLSGPTVSEPAYLEHLIATLLSLAAHGRCVVVGRGAAHLLAPETTLRVRLIAPLEVRIEATARALGLSRQQAARQVARLERERTDFVRQHFHREQADADNYDLLLNCERLRPDECAELIVKALNLLEMRQAQATPAAANTSRETSSSQTIGATLAEHFEM
jgi:cytidylate kinase